MTHSMYADIGGFALRFPRETEEWAPPPRMDATDRYLAKYIDHNRRGHVYLGEYDWGVRQAHYSIVKKLLRSGHANSTNDRYWTLAGDVWIPSAWELLEARKLGILDRLPTMDRAEVLDKSKDDTLVKVLALVQSLWLAVQLAIRASMGRQSLQIEITALAFAVCAFASYLLLLLLMQPKDVAVSATLLASGYWTPNEADFERMAEVAVMVDPWRQKDYSMLNCADTGGNDGTWLALGIVGGLFIFGCVHLVAWNFQFPTATEQLLWRISALNVALLPVLWLVVGSLLNCAGDNYHLNHFLSSSSTCKMGHEQSNGGEAPVLGNRRAFVRSIDTWQKQTDKIHSTRKPLPRKHHQRIQRLLLSTLQRIPHIRKLPIRHLRRIQWLHPKPPPPVLHARIHPVVACALNNLGALRVNPLEPPPRRRGSVA